MSSFKVNKGNDVSLRNTSNSSFRSDKNNSKSESKESSLNFSSERKSKKFTATTKVKNNYGKNSI